MNLSESDIETNKKLHMKNLRTWEAIHLTWEAIHLSALDNADKLRSMEMSLPPDERNPGALILIERELTAVISFYDSGI